MTESSPKFRVVVAITEFSPVDLLWRAAIRKLPSGNVELVTVFIAENHWHRAATLPFTREFSRLSGANADFTPQRAHEVHDAAIARAKTLIEKLARESRFPSGFEVLGEADEERIRDLIAGAASTVIAPAAIRRGPWYERLQRLGCQIEIVDEAAKDREAGDSA